MGEWRVTEVNSLNLAPFDVSDYLDSEEIIAEYLVVALADPDPEAFLVAVADVARTRGIELTETSTPGRNNLVETLKHDSPSRIKTVRRLLGLLDVSLNDAALDSDQVHA